MTLPAIQSAASSNMMDLREKRVENNAMIGAPMTTPKAYHEIIFPATGMTSSQYPYQAKLEIRTFLMTSGKFCRSQII